MFRNLDGFWTMMLIVGIISFIVAMPFIFIWALNVLVPKLAIVYTLKTWFASLIIIGVLASKYQSSE